MKIKLIPVTLALSLSLLLAGVPAQAQDTSINQLIAQYSGAEKAPARSANELRGVFDRIIEHYIPLISADDVRSRHAPKMELFKIAGHVGRRGAEDERMAMGMAIAAKLTPATPLSARIWLVRQLEIMGGSECVPALSTCLNDPDPALSDYARRALENNISSKAGDALFVALRDGKINAVTRIGLIDSLGARGNESAVPLIVQELQNHDDEVAAAAASALARIATAEAIAALEAASITKNDMRLNTITNALLDAAVVAQRKDNPEVAREIYRKIFSGAENPDHRAAALVALATVAPGQNELALQAFGSEYPVMRAAAVEFARVGENHALIKTLTEEMSDVPESLQLQLMGMIGEMGGENTSSAIMAALESPSSAVRLAAIDAAGSLKGPEVAKALLNAAGQSSEEEDAVLEILGRLQGKDIDAVLVDAAKNGEGGTRLVAIQTVASRGGDGALECLSECALSTDSRVASAALRGIGTVGTAKELGMVAEAMMTSRENDTRVAAQRALVMVARREDAAEAASQAVAQRLEDAESASQTIGLLTLRVLGADSGLAAINKLRASDDETLAATATRQLCDWPNYAAMKELMAQASNEATALDIHVLSIRGIARLVGSRDIPAAQRLKDAQAALGIARRDEEKRQLLAAISNLGTTESANAILSYMSDDEIAMDASQAAMALAQRLVRSSPEAAQRIARAIVDLDIDAQLTQEAEQMLSE